MIPKFKEGDIVYFKTPHRAKYTCESGSYDYHFTPGVPYRIENINAGFGLVTGKIINLEDGETHFMHSDLYNSLVSSREWNLNEIFDTNI
jgi:hypothetical protein